MKKKFLTSLTLVREDLNFFYWANLKIKNQNVKLFSVIARSEAKRATKQSQLSWQSEGIQKGLLRRFTPRNDDG